MSIREFKAIIVELMKRGEGPEDAIMKAAFLTAPRIGPSESEVREAHRREADLRNRHRLPGNARSTRDPFGLYSSA